MSRTYRRKGIEAKRNRSGHRAGYKTAGIYTTWDLYERTGNGHGGCPQYREMNKWEKAQEFIKLHTDSKHHNAWSPNRYFRQKYEKYMSTHNRREMLRMERSEDYDPVFMEKPSSHYWDWM